MALEAKWFSTMFGVYCFAGLFLSTLCVITLLLHAFRRVPTVRPAITHRHLYDMGTWMMAFSCFMMYIGFSQYMLIWYANIPEETFYFIARSKGGWGQVFSVALAGGGIRGGTIYGASDRLGAYPKDGLVKPEDITATLFHCLGLPPDREIQDAQGRPLVISAGRVLEPVLT